MYVFVAIAVIVRLYVGDSLFNVCSFLWSCVVYFYGQLKCRCTSFVWWMEVSTDITILLFEF
jgi:hypothetical protein